MLAFLSCPVPPHAMQIPSFSGGGSFVTPFHPVEPSNSFNMVPSHTPRSRPKLSLNTSDITDTFSYKSSSLRLDTISVISPTSRNTFRNICGSTIVQSPQTGTQCPPSKQKSSRALWTSTPHDSAISPPNADFTSVRNQTQSVTADHIGTPGSTITPPGLDLEVRAARAKSKTRNLSRSRNLRPIISLSSSRSPARRMKSVSFREDLTETIHTNTYTLAHSDLLVGRNVEDVTSASLSPSFVLPQRVKAASKPLSKRETRNESRWQAAIEAAEADKPEVSQSSPAKRTSPSEADYTDSDSDSSGSGSDSESKRRRRSQPLSSMARGVST